MDGGMEIGAESGVDVESRIWPKEYSGKCSGKWVDNGEKSRDMWRLGMSIFKAPWTCLRGCFTGPFQSCVLLAPIPFPPALVLQC